MEAIGDIAREKGIAQDKLVSVIQEAVTMAAKRKFKQFEDIEARINDSTGELEVFRYKTVAELPEDPENQISLEEAKKLDTLAEPGDEVEYEIDSKEVSRVIAQTARQLIFQKIREAERETIYETFKDRVGEVLNGIVSRTERGRTFVTLNQTEAILYRREQIPHERYSGGDHIRVILLDVLNDPKEPSLLVISRAHPSLLIKLFEMEVPEIYDGIVEIVEAAREPGRRAKIAVRSHDPDVDPVGACVGLRGSRVQSIISELRGEKIDIIHYTEDLPSYVPNALAPAELSRIKIDDEAREIDVEVEPDQLALAIGRFGQNVRLASKLLGYKINVMSPQDTALSLEEQIRERLLASQAEMGITTPDAEGGEQDGEGVPAQAGAGEEAATATDTSEGTAEPAPPPASGDSAVAVPEPPPAADAAATATEEVAPPAADAPGAETLSAETPDESGGQPAAAEDASGAVPTQAADNAERDGAPETAARDDSEPAPSGKNREEA